MSGEIACQGYIPMTNADRLRSLSDEELAEWIGKAEGDPALVIREQKEWLDWLKEEVKDDNANS